MTADGLFGTPTARLPPSVEFDAGRDIDAGPGVDGVPTAEIGDADIPGRCPQPVVDPKHREVAVRRQRDGDRVSEIAPNGKPVESVWDFPRPPRIERVPWRIRVVHAGATIVDAPEAIRVLETSQAPAYYVAFEHIADELLRHSDHRTFCEWKGLAAYADVIVGDRVAERAAWTYPEPTAPYTDLVGHWAFYAQALDECWVDDERVDPNAGSFYGGWITANVTGPFKGAPGTAMW